MINIFQPSLKSEELEAVRKVFESNWTGKGKITADFEEKFSIHLGVDKKLIKSVSCCTEGMFQAIELLGIGQGDEVILPSLSFVGAANAIAARGARPVFCDVDKRTLNPAAEDIEKKITAKTKAVLILHYGGVPCDMDRLAELVRIKGLKLIEDSACSVASRYKGRACGTFGDVGTWSFDSMKILVTGDGGMIYCNSPELAKKTEESIYLGLVSKSGFSSGVDNKWWEFDISCFGRRAIINDISASIGLEQLKKLPDFIACRKKIHGLYDNGLQDIEWLSLPPKIPDYIESSYYFYWLQMPVEYRDELAVFLRKKGIYTTFRYYPLHWVKFYEVDEKIPNAEKAAESTLCIPMHQSLADEDVVSIVSAIHDFAKTR